MGQVNVNTVAARLQSVLGQEQLNDVGRQTGFLARRRVIEPYRLLGAAVGALSQAGTNTLADIHRMFNGLHGQEVRYKPFHNQLAKETFAEFTRECACIALGSLTSRVLEPTREELRRFKAILIQDGTSFAVHKGLVDTFPGRFTKISPAAVELHVRMELLNGTPEAVVLTPDTYGERAELPRPDELTDTLLLADRGYFDMGYCHQVATTGGSFLFKAPGNLNPRVEAAWREDGAPVKGVAGKLLKEVRGKLSKRGDIDMDICWRKNGADLRFRLIIHWSSQRKRHEYLVTNLPRERYDLRSIECLYRLRWQIELLFKEWKSYTSLRLFNTEKAPIVEGLIWSSLIALILKRYIAGTVQQLRNVWLSWQKVAKTASYWLLDIMKALSAGCRSALSAAFDAAGDYLQVNAQRAHPKRDGKTGLTQYGLGIVLG